MKTYYFLVIILCYLGLQSLQAQILVQKPANFKVELPLTKSFRI